MRVRRVEELIKGRRHIKTLRSEQRRVELSELPVFELIFLKKLESGRALSRE
jgi:hypothetical protein